MPCLSALIIWEHPTSGCSFCYGDKVSAIVYKLFQMPNPGCQPEPICIKHFIFIQINDFSTVFKLRLKLISFKELTIVWFLK
ncbi:hypothetical protein BIV59_10995 [Bacillus sp. MUM 13]|nr:hypothetical protein BIV59_10995 [Bacillus sp. MUM 13]